jgi:tetratricopeptide (TPR) repeat protein
MHRDLMLTRFNIDLHSRWRPRRQRGADSAASCKDNEGIQNRYKLCLTCLAIVVVAMLAPLRVAAQADRIYAENSKAVVVVVAANEEAGSVSQGSGFLVREDGAVVTNYHVINAASKIRVKVGEQVFDVEGLLYADAENDVAILKIDGTNFPKVRLGESEKVQVGEKVFVISSPQGFENTVSEGILSGIRKVDGTRKVLQITAAISPGSSGAPVFNSKGEAIGIATFLVAEAQNINFAMPINLIKDKLTATKVVPAGEACSADFTRTAECWFYQGVAYGSNGMYERSTEAFVKAIQIKPDFSEAYYNLGVSYVGLGKYKEAREALEKAIQIKPDSADAYENLGAVFSKLGMHDDAIRTLKKAIAINAEDAQAYYNLGVNYAILENYKAAVEALKQAIRFQPDFAAAHGFLGVTYAKMKNYKMAADALKQSIRLKPDDARSHYALGETYLSLEDRPSALDEYKILQKLDATAAENLFKQIYK